jgi:hypothetical protein
MLPDARVNPEFLEAGAMDFARVKSAITSGRPLSSGDRFYAWLFLLHVMPAALSEWPAEFSALRQSYRVRVDALGPPGDARDGAAEQIRIDVVRTGRLLFFLPTEAQVEVPAGESDPFFEYRDHFRRIERILRVLARITSQCECMQGINEIATVFYFVSLENYFDSKTRTFSHPDACDWAEAFACFFVQQVLTTGNLLPFYLTADRSRMIAQQLEPFALLLERHFPKCAAILKSAGVEPVYYALRWFTLLFSQEHDLPSLLLIWDDLFLHFSAFRSYLCYMGVAHVHLGEASLAPKDSSKSLHAVQHLKVSGRAGEIIEIAERLWAADHAPPMSRHPSIGDALKSFFTGDH